MTSLNHLHSSKYKGKSSKTGALVQKSSYKFVMILMCAFGLVILIQAFRWQILESDKFATITKQQYTDTGKQTAQRGMILAEDGTILAVDQPAWNVYASLSKDKRERELFFSKKDLFVSTVASILAVETDTIRRK